MCDVNATVEQLAAKGVTCSPVSDQGWGLLTSVRLPGGSELGLNEPRHPKVTDLWRYSWRSRDSTNASSASHCSTAVAYGPLGRATVSGSST